MKVKDATTTMLLILTVAALSPLGLQYATADDGEKDPYGIKTQAFDPEKRYDDIPDSVLLERGDTEWTAQKLSNPEFVAKQDAVKAYLSYDMTKNAWNEAARRAVLVTHNFDVMSGEAGNGFELVALSKALDKRQGVYSATVPEKRLHDWLANRYTVPANTADIA